MAAGIENLKIWSDLVNWFFSYEILSAKKARESPTKNQKPLGGCAA